MGARNQVLIAYSSLEKSDGVGDFDQWPNGIIPRKAFWWKFSRVLILTRVGGRLRTSTPDAATDESEELH